jgi:hypothetical protein
VTTEENIFRVIHQAAMDEREVAKRQLAIVVQELKSRSSNVRSVFLADVIENLETAHRRLDTSFNAMNIALLACINDEEAARGVSSRESG